MPDFVSLFDKDGNIIKWVTKDLGAAGQIQKVVMEGSEVVPMKTSIDAIKSAVDLATIAANATTAAASAIVAKLGTLVGGAAPVHIAGSGLTGSTILTDAVSMANISGQVTIGNVAYTVTPDYVTLTGSMNLIAATAAKKNRILYAVFSPTEANTLTLKDGSGGSTIGFMDFGAVGAAYVLGYHPHGWLKEQAAVNTAIYAVVSSGSVHCMFGRIVF